MDVCRMAGGAEEWMRGTPTGRWGEERGGRGLLPVLLINGSPKVLASGHLRPSS